MSYKIYRCWVALALVVACEIASQGADLPRDAQVGVHESHDRVVAFVDAQLQVLRDSGDWQGEDIAIAFLGTNCRWNQAWELTRKNFDRGERVVVVPTYNLPWEELDLGGASLNHARTAFPRTPITARKIGVPELLRHLDEQGIAVVGIGFSRDASFVLQENALLLVRYGQQQARSGGHCPSIIVINAGGISEVAHGDRLRAVGYDVKQAGEGALVTAVEKRFADFDPIGLRIPALGVLGYVGNALSHSGKPFGSEGKHGYAAFRNEVNRALVDAAEYNSLVKGLTGSEAPFLDASAEMQRRLDRQVALDRSVQRALVVRETLDRIEELGPQGSIRKELIVNALDKIEHDRIQQNRGEIIRTALDRIKAERNRLTAGENKRTLVVLPRQRGAILKALGGKEEDLRIVEQTDRVVRRYVGHMRWSIVEYKTSEDAFLIYDATGEDTDEARENVLEMVEKLDESGVIMVGNPDSPAYKQLRDAFKDAGVEINGEVSTKSKSKEEILRDIVQLHEKVGGIVVERKDLAVVDDPTPDPQELEYEIEETDEGWKITFRIGDVPIWEMILDEDGNVICEGPPGTCDGWHFPDNYREPREPEDRMKQEEKQQEVENSDVDYDVEKRKDGTIQITITINDVPVWEIVLDENGNIVCQGPPGWCNGDGGAPALVGPLVPVPDPVTDFRLPDKPCDSDPILAWIPHSPTLDRLATLGLRFSPVFSVNPLCSPTRATLLASRLSGATHEALRRPTIAARSFSRLSCQGLFADISSTPVGADVFRDHVLPITRFSRVWPNVATVPPAPNRPATAMDGLSQLRSCLAVSSVAMADTGVMPCRIWLTGMLLADESIQAGDRIETLSDAPVMNGETTRGVVRAGTHLSAQKVSGNWVLITVEQSGQKLHGWIDVENVVVLTEEEASALVSRGEVWLMKGEYDKAIADCSKAIGIDPNCDWAFANRGLAWLMKGDYEKAIADLTKTIEINPNHDWALASRGAAWLMKGDYDKAIADCSRAIEIDPSSDVAFANRGLAWRMKDEYDKAVTDLTNAIEINPNHDMAFANRGEAWLMKDEYDKAIADYSKAIEINPSCDASFANRGAAWRMKGEYDKAIADCSRAIELDPNCDTSFANRGAAWRMKGDYDKAFADWRKAIELNPTRVWVYDQLAHVWIEQNNFDKAMAVGDKVIAVAPDDTSSYLLRSFILHEFDRNDEALADAERVIQIAPDSAEGYTARANALHGKMAYKEAVSGYTKAIELAPKDGWLYVLRANARNGLANYDEAIADALQARAMGHKGSYGCEVLGNAWLGKGDYNRARAEYEEALELDPDSIRAYAGRAAVWIELGEPDKATRDCSRAIRLEPRYVAAYANRAAAWNVKGDYEKAIADCNSALQFNANSASVFNNRGNAWAHLGRMEEALADYDQAIRLAPTLAGAYVNRAHVKLALEDCEKAMADYERALELSPDLPNALVGRGAAKLARGDLDEAIADYDRVLERDPSYCPALLGRGAAKRAKRDFAGALADFGEVIRVDPTIGEGYYARADVLPLTGRHKEAVADFREAIRKGLAWSEAR